MIHGSGDSRKNSSNVKKISSQTQVQSSQSTHVSIENEKIKKMRKTQPFDRNNQIETRHTIDNKKIKTKH